MSLDDFVNPHKPTDVSDYEWGFRKVANNEIPDWSILDVGTLDVPSGKLVVDDPFSNFWEAEPFVRRVPKGRFPVRILRKWDGVRQRNLFVRVYFSQQVVKTWELAVAESQIPDLHDLPADEYLGFEVEGGMGFVCDSLVHQQMIQILASNGLKQDSANLYDDYFCELLQENADPKNPNDLGEWCNHKLEGASGNIILASPAMGDGVYGSWWGYDQAGELATLVIDFNRC